MARQKYIITASDHWFARRWIEKKLANPLWLGEQQTFRAAEDFEQLDERSESLNAWCELWLGSGEWKQMKNAIRAARLRAREHETKSVTLSRNAWAILDFWAEKEGCTLSEVIEKRLG